MMKRKPCCQLLFQTILLIIFLNRVIMNLAKITNFIHNHMNHHQGLEAKIVGMAARVWLDQVQAGLLCPALVT